MVFSEEDIELLRLVRWCRIILPDTLEAQFPEGAITNLIAFGLIRKHRTSGALMLTSKGHSLLETVFRNLPENTPPVYKDADTLRRIRLSSVMLTAYRAGMMVFSKELTDIQEPNTYINLSLTRVRGKNPWDNSRIGGILHLNDWLYAVHYVCPEIGNILLNKELSSFTNNTSRIREVQRGFLFAGASYESLLTELNHEPEHSDNQRVSYAEAYRQVRLPVHLLSCDDTGAHQLQLMSIPDYRQRITHAALRSHYEEANGGNGCWDAMFQGMPFVMAVDMNLRRIDEAIRTAKEAGYPKIALVCLEGQAKTVFFPCYQERGLATVYILADDAMTEAAGYELRLYQPEARQFETEEGAVINAPVIKTDRKTGRSCRKPARKLV